MFLNYNSALRKVSKELRTKQTKAEIEMWYFLKKNFSNYKFNRQRPIDNFIVDFHCEKLNLVIEVDGGIHDKQKERDLERDNYLLYKYKMTTLDLQMRKF